MVALMPKGYHLAPSATVASEEEASKALRLLDLGADPMIAVFSDAPLDDEPFTDTDEAALAEARADIAAGRAVAHTSGSKLTSTPWPA
jgi:hypothetical protein